LAHTVALLYQILAPRMRFCTKNARVKCWWNWHLYMSRFRLYYNQIMKAYYWTGKLSIWTFRHYNNNNIITRKFAMSSFLLLSSSSPMTGGIAANQVFINEHLTCWNEIVSPFRKKPRKLSLKVHSHLILSFDGIEKYFETF